MKVPCITGYNGDMATYIYAVDKHDKHGIDESDFHVICEMLQKEFPQEKFSSGIVNGILGIRIADRRFDDGALSEYRAFVKGAMATRNLWER